jgi:hypothetical protein
MSVASVEPRTLPPPVIDPADVQAVLPSLTPEEATLYASLATLALSAAAWPNPLPAAPLPAPLHSVGLSLAVRLAASIEATSESAGQVVSESIGAYTYRLANPLSFDGALKLTETERDLARPWLGQASVYDVRTGLAHVYDWPDDWWQRDLDRLVFYVPQPETETSDYLTEAEADALYSKLGHTHAEIVSGEWSFSTNVVAEDPGKGKLRLNTADPALATELYFDPLTVDDVDVSLVLDKLGPGDAIRLQDRDDSTRWQQYDVSAAAVPVTGWLRVPIVAVGASGTLALSNNLPLFVIVRRAGHP